MTDWLNLLATQLPAIFLLAALLFVSAALSCSEAAIFFLTPQDCQDLEKRGGGGRAAIQLLRRPEQLLSTVLFLNLLVNTLYFVLSTVVAEQLQSRGSPLAAAIFGICSFVMVIVFGEMLPKSLGVMRPKLYATLLSLPLEFCIRAITPLLPSLQFINTVSRRLVAPTLREEAYLELGDIERAITVGTQDADLLEQEQRVLKNLITLSEMSIEEAMLPRNQLTLHQEPLSLRKIRELGVDRGYAFLAEPDTDEIAAAIPLAELEYVPDDGLDRLAASVHYVPWSANCGDVFDAMQRRGFRVAAVVNEYGETLGVVTREDFLESIFSDSPSRTMRVLRRQPVTESSPGVWQVSGITSLRRVARHFAISRPVRNGQTVAGLFHEELERLPEPGDQVTWGPLEIVVVDSEEPEDLVAEIRMRDEETNAE